MGTQGAFVDGKGLPGASGQVLCLLHALTSQVFRGTAWTGLQGAPAMVQSPAGVEHGSASLLRPAWARARLRARRDLDGGDSFMEQKPSDRASCSSASSFSSCWDSWRLRAMASAAKSVKSMVLLFL